MNSVFGKQDEINPFIPYSHKHRGRRLAAAIRVRIASDGKEPTVRQVTRHLVEWRYEESLLDAVDAVLHFGEAIADEVDALDELLSLGGSVWEVDPLSRRKLVRRVDPTATAAFMESSTPGDVASAELKEAWTAAHGRNPDASDAWDHSIKAVEAILIPIVTPTNGKATLGSVIKTLNDQGDLWCLALQGHDRSASAEPLVAMLRRMWPNPDRHGGKSSRQPSLEEAQAVVYLAVMVVQWARSGVLYELPFLASLRSLVLLHHRRRMRPRSLNSLPCALAYSRTAELSTRFRGPRA